MCGTNMIFKPGEVKGSLFSNLDPSLYVILNMLCGYLSCIGISLKVLQLGLVGFGVTLTIYRFP